ncbi:Uncharacterised protein [Pseudomonas aeruginosa]|nr:Uncharacterised protein [Pseudomonas aeruginosa]
MDHSGWARRPAAGARGQADHDEGRQAGQQAVDDRRVGEQAVASHAGDHRQAADDDAGDRPLRAGAAPQQRADDGYQQAADQQVVGDAQGGYDIVDQARQGQHRHAHQQSDATAQADVAGSSGAQETRVDVFLQHGGRRQQAAAGGGHDRRQRGRHHQAAQARCEHLAGDLGVGVLRHRQVRQEDPRRRADQRAGGAVEHAVDTGAKPGVAHHRLAARGEYPLPDVLADQRAEEIQQEVGEDRVQADVAEVEEARRQHLLHARQAAGTVDRQWQQDEEDTDGLDHELDDVGEGQRPHAADHRIDDDDPASAEDRRDPRDTEDHLGDRADGDGRGDRHHQVVGDHHHPADQPRGGLVALFQHLGHGEYPQARDLPREHQAEDDDPKAEHEHQPQAGQAELVAELDRADGRGAAEHHRRHGAQVETGAETASGDEEVALAPRLAHSVPAQAQHGQGVDQHDQIIQQHRPRSSSCCSA